MTVTYYEYNTESDMVSQISCNVNMVLKSTCLPSLCRKVREIHEKLSKTGTNEIVLAADVLLENVDIAHFISIFCQRIRVVSVSFCYTADKLESGKTF